MNIWVDKDVLWDQRWWWCYLQGLSSCWWHGFDEIVFLPRLSPPQLWRPDPFWILQPVVIGLSGSALASQMLRKTELELPWERSNLTTGTSLAGSDGRKQSYEEDVGLWTWTQRQGNELDNFMASAIQLLAWSFFSTTAFWLLHGMGWWWENTGTQPPGESCFLLFLLLTPETAYWPPSFECLVVSLSEFGGA